MSNTQHLVGRPAKPLRASESLAIGGLDPITAVSQGWSLFQKCWVPLTLISVLTTGLYVGINLTCGQESNDPDFAWMNRGVQRYFVAEVHPAAELAQLVLLLLSICWCLRAALVASAGQQCTLKKAVTGFNYLTAALLAVVVVVATAIGTILLVVPGILAYAVLSFAFTGVLDGKGFTVSLRHCVTFGREQLLPVALLWVLHLVILTAGVMLFCVGYLPASLVVFCVYACAYRQATCEPVLLPLPNPK